MKSFAAILTGAGICAAGCVALAQGPMSPRDMGSYRVLQTRNIFDPDREPYVASAAPRPRIVEAQRRSAGYVMLTGVMVTPERSLAFFSGSQPEYDKVIAVNAEIAGAKLTKITSAGVEVDRGGRKINVPVGLTVPFDDSTPGAPPASAGDTTAASAPPAAPGLSTTPNPPSSGNIDEVMRRMMERRQKELQ